jgi:hypothetical protein
MAQGITGFAGGRPAVTPLVRLFSCLVPKDWLDIAVSVDGQAVDFAAQSQPSPQPSLPVKQRGHAPRGEGVAAVASAILDGTFAPKSAISVPLIALAYGRSGDKGDSANIGVLARKPEFVALLREQLTAESVREYLAHFIRGKVERFEIPGLHGFNFLLHQALGGGGMASLRYDPQGKMLAQILMDLPLQVPLAWVEQGLVTAEPA